MEEKVSTYQESLELYKKLIKFLEAELILSKHGEKNFNFSMRIEIGSAIDLANRTVNELFPELFEYLGKNKGVIHFADSYKEWIKFLDELEKSDPVLYTKMNKDYSRLLLSFDFVREGTKKAEWNVVDLFIRNRQYDKIMEFILGDPTKVSEETKKSIIMSLIENYPDCLSSVISAKPDSFQGDAEQFSRAARLNIRESLDNYKDNVAILRKQIGERLPDENAKLNALNIVRFFVEVGITYIDMIQWSIGKSSAISSAAVAYCLKNPYLGEYLYSLPTNLDPTLRLSSDNAILEVLSSGWISIFIKFIQNPNFEVTPGKIYYIGQLLSKAKITKNEMETILNILLRKAKKDNYKEIKTAIAALRVNSNICLLKEERQNLVRTLNQVLESLPVDAPAKLTLNMTQERNNK